MSAIPPRLRPLLDAASPAQQLARLLSDAGHECYLVGGSVRDAFLDRARRDDEDVDVDFTTDARPDVIEAIVRPWADAVWLQGKRFGTIGCRKDGTLLEITTFRAEVYRPDSRKPEVVFSDDLTTDLSRRDFTVNAMALRLPEPELVDPFDGAIDLAAHRLRTPLGPEVSFVDDPLRMLPRGALHRAVRPRARPGAHRRGRRVAPPPRDRERRAHPRRAVEAPPRRRSERGAVVPRRDRSVRRVPARAQPDAPRAGPDPHPQGRARAHDRGGAQHPTRAAGAARRAVPRRRQAEDPLVRRRRCQLPPSRGGRRAA